MTLIYSTENQTIMEVAKAEDMLCLYTPLGHRQSYRQCAQSSSHYIAAKIMNLHIILSTFYQ